VQRTRRSANAKFGSIKGEDLALVGEAGINTAGVRYELRSTSVDAGEDLLDDIGEDFRDRPCPAIGEHQVDVGTTIAIATAPAPSSATKAFVRHALKSELNAAHI
jgi:hypothetical protein